MINIKLIPWIEKALGFELYPEVIQYLTTKEECEWIGRKSGRTTAHILKLALDKDKVINLSDLKKGKYNDEVRNLTYNSWFTNEFLYIGNLLAAEGFEVIKVTKN